MRNFYLTTSYLVNSYSIKRFYYVLSLSLFVPLTVWSTIIIPPTDLGEMVYNTDYIVYGKVISHVEGDSYLNNFQLIDVIKGDLTIGETILLKEYGSQSGDLITSISGDVDFKIGQEYLLFLFKDGNGHYKADLLSLSVFEYSTIDKTEILAHSPDLLEISFVGHVNPDLTGAYLKEELLNYLRQIADGKKNWNAEDAGFVSRVYKGRGVRDTNHSHSRSAGVSSTDHCTVVIGELSDLTPTCTADSPAKFESNNWDVCVAFCACAWGATVHAIFGCFARVISPLGATW